MTLALLCSGQGLQGPDMFRLTANEPLAQSVFDEAERVLGEDARALVQSGNSDRWRQNRTAQVLCLASALATFACLKPYLGQVTAVAGYSVGLVAAFVVAERLSMPAAFDLVAARAACMDAAVRSPQGLVSVGGLSRATVEAQCHGAGAHLAIANPAQSYVIGGDARALDDLVRRVAARTSARVTRLAVNVASHTPLMRTASEAFAKVLAETIFLKPGPSAPALCDGLVARWVQTPDEGTATLRDQLSMTIEWEECLNACIERGADNFLELGPGTALRVMVQRLGAEVQARAAEEFSSTAGIGAWAYARC